MEALKALLNNSIGLTESEWEVLRNVFQTEIHPAKTSLVREGQTAKKIYFIREGLMRAYLLRDGKEVNTYFATDHQFISTYASLIAQGPSVEILETIEETSVYSLSYTALTNLYQTMPKFEKLGRILAEQNYLCVVDRTVTMQTKTAKEKYLDFVKNYPKKIVQRVPQHHIASFLGIAPESLSRVRRTVHTS